MRRPVRRLREACPGLRVIRIDRQRLLVGLHGAREILRVVALEELTRAREGDTAAAGRICTGLLALFVNDGEVRRLMLRRTMRVDGGGVGPPEAIEPVGALAD